MIRLLLFEKYSPHRNDVRLYVTLNNQSQSDMRFKNLVPCCALLQHTPKKNMSTGSVRKALRQPQHDARGGQSFATTKNHNKVSSKSNGSMTSATSGSSRKRGNSYDEDSSTLSSSRAEELEEELDRVTRENMELVKENEKLMALWENEKQEKELYHKRVMKKALQTVTMERETYAKVKRYAQEKLFRFVKFITSENELRDLESPSSIANHTMDELEIAQEDRIAWWAVYKVAITDGIAERRNQINMNMKQWVVSK